MPMRIAVCADDFGLDGGINHAILELATAGRISGAGCLVGTPAWPRAKAECAALRAAGLELGLHLDLTDHAQDRCLARPLLRLVAAALTGGLDANALEREIATQIDRFEQQVGASPDYVDGHRHVHQLAPVRRALITVLARRGLRPWLRSTRHPLHLQAPQGSGWRQRIKPHVIEWLGARGLQRDAAAAGLPHSRHLLGVHGFCSDEAQYRRWIDAWLAVAGEGDVLMCHPSQETSGAGDPLADARYAERNVLRSAWLAEALVRHAIVIGRHVPLGH